MDETSARSLELHRKLKGKIEVVSRAKATTADDLALLYTPGVAEPCRQIAADYAMSWELTRRHNLVAVITDGTAVLGLGDIGPAAGMPVMEGKCLLFKEFGGVDAFPICIDTHDVDEAVRTIHLISKSFGGINLEDIAAPRCFEIERRLKELCDIPVFHDDQHGTAIVCAAGLMNAFKVTGRELGSARIVISGAGAAGLAIGELLVRMGFGDVVACDRQGALYAGRPGMNEAKAAFAEISNASRRAGSLADVLAGADVFVGVSQAGLVTREMVASMATEPIVFAMANPVPEIMPDEAHAGGAAVVATGRSDFPNQVNNVLVFPGVFKGALAVRAPQITEEMEVAAARAIADHVGPDELAPEFVIPSALDRRVADAVAAAVASCVDKRAVTAGAEAYQ